MQGCGALARTVNLQPGALLSMVIRTHLSACKFGDDLQTFIILSWFILIIEAYYTQLLSLEDIVLAGSGEMEEDHQNTALFVIIYIH